MKPLSSTKLYQYSKTFIVILLIMEVVSTLTAFRLAFWQYSGSEANLTNEFYFYASFWFLLWIVLNLILDHYNVDNHRRILKIVRYTLVTVLYHVPLLTVWAYFMDASGLNTGQVFSLYVLFTCVSLLFKISAVIFYRFIRGMDRNKHRAIIVGYTPSGSRLYKYFMQERSSGYEFAGFFDNHITHPLVLGNLHDMRKYCIRHNVNEIFYALPYDEYLVKEISDFADDNFIRLALVQDTAGLEPASVTTKVFDNNLSVLAFRPSQAAKRENLMAGYKKALSALKFLNF